MLISIVMPIYNSELYLQTAIESVMNQTHENFELILIDDCSADFSSSIARKFEKKDSRIKFFQNDYNIGICATRNKGIDVSIGNYITFLDNDDELDRNFLHDNIRLLIDKKADAIRFGRVLIDVSKAGNILRTSESVFFNEEVKVFTAKSKYDYYHYFKKNNLLLNVWNGLYRRKIIVENNLFFDESMKFGSEDAKFSYDFFNACDSIIINPKSYYIHYRRDLSSTSRKYSKNKIESILKTAFTESKIWECINNQNEHQYINDYKIQYIKIIISSQLLHNDCDLTNKEKQQVIKRVINDDSLKINEKSFRKKFTLTSLFEFLVLHEKVSTIFYMYYIYKIFSGERWN